LHKIIYILCKKAQEIKGLGMIQKICTFPPSQDFSHDEAIETIDFKQYGVFFGIFGPLVSTATSQAAATGTTTVPSQAQPMPPMASI